MAIVQVTDGGKERATMTPRLVVKLPLPKVLPHGSIPLPPYREVQAPHIKADKKRGYGFLSDSEENSDKSMPVLTGETTIKRQRISKTVSQSTQEDTDLPKPRGQPEVWAEVTHIQ